MNAPMTAIATLAPPQSRRVHILKQLERKLLWLSAWMIHNANHIRPNRDGLKVGGHQASCASCISILAALYFEIARPQDRIAVKPHAGPELPPGRYIAVAGDAELDEGNIYEALLEGWKHDVRKLWWIVDYNRQSLD